MSAWKLNLRFCGVGRRSTSAALLRARLQGSMARWHSSQELPRTQQSLFPSPVILPPWERRQPAVTPAYFCSSSPAGGGLAVGTVLLIGETQSQHILCELTALFNQDYFLHIYTSFSNFNNYTYMEFSQPCSLDFKMQVFIPESQKSSQFSSYSYSYAVANQQTSQKSFWLFIQSEWVFWNINASHCIIIVIIIHHSLAGRQWG